MKGKQLAILLVLVVVLGGAGWYLQKGNQTSWATTAAGTGGKVVNLPLNDVAQIAIKSSEGEVNLAKKNDAWVVADRADYPAEFTKISDLLRNVWDLKTLQDVKVGPSQFGRLGLLEPGKGAESATLVDFKDKDGKRLEALYLGKILRNEADPEMAQFGSTGPARGRYVKPAADGAKVSLVIQAFEDAEAKPEKWLAPAFIRVDGLTSVDVKGAAEAQTWKLTRETATADWKLDGAKPEEQIDASKVSALNFTYSNPSFIDVLTAAKPEETGLDKPTVATLGAADGFTYTLKIGKAQGENYPLTVEVAGSFPKERTPGKDEKPEDKKKLDDEFQATLKKHEEKLATEKKLEGHVFLVAKSTVEPLLKDRTGLLAEKKPETPATPPVSGTPGISPDAEAIIREKLEKALPVKPTILPAPAPKQE